MSYLAALGVPPRYRAIAETKPDFTLPDLTSGRWVFLFGPAGCGKTHRAVEILHAHFARVGRPAPSSWRPWHHTRRPAPGPQFIDWPCFLEAYRRSFGRDRGDGGELEEFGMARLILENQEVVLLDDLGSERPTEFALDCVNVVISSRYNRKPFAPTIITSNLPLDAIATTYGDRIASRIREAALVADQSGADWRTAIARGETC